MEAANQLPVAIGDFNGDGKPDLAVVSQDKRGVGLIILLGNGDGHFRPGTSYHVGSQASWVATGDLNGDGNLDLVVVDASASLVVLLGNGDGTFRLFSISDLKGSFVAATDLNGDGKPDLVVGGDGYLVALLGNADGTFQRPAIYPATGMDHFAVADLNGDGRPDVVATGSNSTNSIYSIWINNGDGSFPSPTTRRLGFNSIGVAIADFDGDGKPDLVMANADLGAIDVLAGDGHGRFAPPVANFAAGTALGEGRVRSGVTVADFNGDGKPDVVTPDGSLITVLLNTTPAHR